MTLSWKTIPAVASLVLCFACGDDPTAPVLDASGTYDMVLRSIGGTCGFADDPLPVVLEVSQDGEALTLRIIESSTSQTLVYVGSIDPNGGFSATLFETSPELPFTAEAMVEGTLRSGSVMATEEFEIRHAEEFGQPDCTDIARWEGTRR